MNTKIFKLLCVVNFLLFSAPSLSSCNEQQIFFSTRNYKNGIEIYDVDFIPKRKVFSDHSEHYIVNMPDTFFGKKILKFTNFKNNAKFEKYNNILLGMPNDLEEIGDYCFYGLSNFLNVNLANTETIGSYAFSNATIDDLLMYNNLKYIKDHAFDNFKRHDPIAPAIFFSNNSRIFPSILSIGDYAFNNCRIYEFRAPSCKYVGKYAFFKNPISLYSFDEAEHIDDYAFSDSSFNIDEMTIKNVDCDFGYGVFMNSNFKSIENELFSGISSKNIYKSGVLAGQKQIENITCFEEEKIIKRAFYNCTSLKTITIPTTILRVENEAFLNCESLEELIIPKNVNYVGSTLFKGCKSLKKLIIEGRPSYDLDVFNGISEETKIYIEKNTNLYNYCKNKNIKVYDL